MFDDKIISANALKRNLIDDKSFYPAIVNKAIEDAPEAVVRCERCIRYDPENYQCNIPGESIVLRAPYDFCSHGMTKEQLQMIESWVDQGYFDRTHDLSAKEIKEALQKPRKEYNK